MVFLLELLIRSRHLSMISGLLEKLIIRLEVSLLDRTLAILRSWKIIGTILLKCLKEKIFSENYKTKK